MPVKRIKANYMDETGKPSNQEIQLVLGLDSKGKISPRKEHFGKLIEAVDAAQGAFEIYPFIAKLSSTKEKELILDYGSSLQEDSGDAKKETESKPMGFRWARLTIVQNLSKDGVLTLQGMEGERSNFRIRKVEDY